MVYPKNGFKKGLSKAIMKKQLLRTIVTIERGVTISNGYPKIVKTIADGLQTVTKRPSILRVLSYLNTSIIHVPPINFLFHYVISIVKCSFPYLLCLLWYSFPFVFGPMLL